MDSTLTDSAETDDIGVLAGIYYTIEELILKKISRLPSYGKDCDCDQPAQFCVVGNNSTSCYCLNCGGNYIQ